MKRPSPCACPSCGVTARPLRRTGYRLGGTLASVTANLASYLTHYYMCGRCKHMWPTPANEVQI